MHAFATARYASSLIRLHYPPATAFCIHQAL